MGIRSWVEGSWWRKSSGPSALLLRPLSFVYGSVGKARTWAFRKGLFKQEHVGVPVIAVGNVVVGGAGKTPVVQSIVRCLQQFGYRPGVVSRGYPVSPKRPILVRPESSAKVVGDEPLLHAALGIPVVVCADRVAACRELLARHSDVNVIVADDGLQHYRLFRDIEVEVVSQERGYGNAALLPAGPLREPRARARDCDLRIMTSWNPPSTGYKDGNHHVAVRKLQKAYALADPSKVVSLSHFSNSRPYIVAGIANPRQFADALKRQGIDGKLLPFADHHEFSWGDFATLDARPILMTEKDAVKCKSFAQPDMWVVPMSVHLAPQTKRKLLDKLSAITGHRLDMRALDQGEPAQNDRPPKKNESQIA